jgi:hypothetical protein
MGLFPTLEKHLTEKNVLWSRGKRNATRVALEEGKNEKSITLPGCYIPHCHIPGP